MSDREFLFERMFESEVSTFNIIRNAIHDDQLPEVSNESVIDIERENLFVPSK